MPFDGTDFDETAAAIDILCRARERLARPGGWSICGFEHNGALCIVAAVRDAAGLDIYENFYQPRPMQIAMERLYRALPKEWTGDPARTLMTYNDCVLRTQDQALALIDFAIEGRPAPRFFVRFSRAVGGSLFGFGTLRRQRNYPNA